jgi:putative nucleotide binding protein
MSSKAFFRKKAMENYAYILDIFDGERRIRVKRFDGTFKEIRVIGLIGQLIGESCFTLMEFQLNKEAIINFLERAYVGKGPRNKAIRFVRLIKYKDLTYRAKENLPKAIEKAILLNEDAWIDFFNRTGPINIRTHTLELLRMIGKKTVFKIIEERERRPFESFRDFYNRINVDPV